MISESKINKTNANNLLGLVEDNPDLEHFHIRLAHEVVIIKLDSSFGVQIKEALDLQPVISLSYLSGSHQEQYLLRPFCVPNDFNDHPEIKRKMEPGYNALENFVQRYATPVPKE